MRTCVEQSLVVTYREKCSLENAQEETGHHHVDKVVSNSDQDRDDAPKGHTSREVYRGFPEVIKKHVPIQS